MNPMNPAVIDFVKDRWPLFLGYGFFRRLAQGKSLMRTPSNDPGMQEYEADLAKWQWIRAIVLDAEDRRMRRWISKNYGHTIPFGPFQGMKYRACQRELSAAARLGYYEAELHSYVDEVVRRNYRRVLNIGCSFGYYAVGLALRMPECEILAFDIDQRARERCRQLAEENGVADQVVIGERFDPEMFAKCADEHTLVLCDIEGAEMDLLDPAHSETLGSCDILVELHDVFDPNMSVTLPNRFRATHEVIMVPEGDHPALTMPEPMRGMGALERLVACHGAQRWGGTPWAFLSSHSRKLRLAG